MPGFICGMAVGVANPACTVGVAEGGNQITVAVGSGVEEGRRVAVAGIASAGAHAVRRIPMKRMVKNTVRMK
jgi:hypothetical protein